MTTAPKRRTRRTAGPLPREGTAVTGHLLAALSRQFDAQVLGPDRRRLVVHCLDISGRHTSGESGPAAGQDRLAVNGLLDGVSRLDVNLTLLPMRLVRRLLDAFAVEIHQQPHGSGVRLAIQVSAFLRPRAAGPPGLRIDLPEGWPWLTPGAARALLRLVIRVAERRDAAAIKSRGVA